MHSWAYYDLLTTLFLSKARRRFVYVGRGYITCAWLDLWAHTDHFVFHGPLSLLAEVKALQQQQQLDVYLQHMRHTCSMCFFSMGADPLQKSVCTFWLICIMMYIWTMKHICSVTQTCCVHGLSWPHASFCICVLEG